MKAERIARLLHAGQWYIKDVSPYIRHVEDVVDGVGDEDKNVAWLHDVLEDTDVTTNELLDLGVSHETLEAVIVLTRRESGETYAQYIDRIAMSCNKSAIRVKIADLRANIAWAAWRQTSKGSLKIRYEASLIKLEDLV